MRRFLGVLGICALLSGVAKADIFYEDEATFPDILDLPAANAALESSFPQLILGNGVKTRDAIANYRQALELYRAGNLEGFSRQIRAVCVQIKKHEGWLHNQAKQGAITRSFYQSQLARIELERMKCDTKNYHTSEYWQLYDRLLQRYRTEESKSRSQLNNCMSQNACRQRKN